MSYLAKGFPEIVSYVSLQYSLVVTLFFMKMKCNTINTITNIYARKDNKPKYKQSLHKMQANTTTTTYPSSTPSMAAYMDWPIYRPSLKARVRMKEI